MIKKNKYISDIVKLLMPGGVMDFTQNKIVPGIYNQNYSEIKRYTLMGTVFIATLILEYGRFIVPAVYFDQKYDIINNISKYYDKIF